ncbi:MAG: HepT-like ribonuclease domain-containing protein [Thermoplasmata archaeon]
MLEAIERTHGYVARGRVVFFSDYDTRELVIHHLEHLAASADQASQRFKGANPLVPWADLRDLRTLLIHQYMRPQADRVWAFVSKQLPLVERRLRKARFTEPPEPNRGNREPA